MGLNTLGSYKVNYVSDIFLYTMFGGKLIKYKGYGHFNIYDEDFKRFGVDEGIYGRFHTVTIAGKAKTFAIDSKSGIVCNNTVWFQDERDNEARDILIANMKSKIEATEAKIKTYQQNIELLKNGSFETGSRKAPEFVLNHKEHKEVVK